MTFLLIRSPHFCIIRFCHIDMRVDEKHGIIKYHIEVSEERIRG